MNTKSLSAFTVIVGTNGSGKSSILQAMRWGFQSGKTVIPPVLAGCVCRIYAALRCMRKNWSLVTSQAADSMTPRRSLWQHHDMIDFRTLSDDHSHLAHSPLLRGAFLALQYTQEHASIGMTKRSASLARAPDRMLADQGTKERNEMIGSTWHALG